jgi:hypothetical protein
MRVIYNNVDLDLLDDFSISFNKKFNYSGDDDSSLGSFSYSTNIPATTRNLEAISYANGFFNVDGISVEITTDAGNLNAVMIPESIDIDNKVVSVQFIDDVSYLLTIADTLKFSDIIDDVYDFNDNIDNLVWNRRYVDTTGIRREKDNSNFLLSVGLCKDLKGTMPFTLCVSELINKIADMYNLKIEANNNENVEVIIPYKSLISSKFKSGDMAGIDTKYVNGGMINYTGVHEDMIDNYYTQALSSFTGSRMFMSLASRGAASGYISINNRELLGYATGTNDSGKTNLSRSYFIPTYTYRCIPSFKTKLIDDEETRTAGMSINFTRKDGSASGTDTSYLSTGGRVSMYVELCGNMYKIADGYLYNRYLEFKRVSDTDSLFQEPPTIEAGETFDPILHIVAEEEITFYDTTGTCPDIVWLYNEFTCDATDYKVAHLVSFKSNLSGYSIQLETEMELLPYDENIDYVAISGLNINSYTLSSGSSEDLLNTSIRIGDTFDTSDISVRRIIEDYIKRFNKSIYSYGDKVIIGSKNAEEKTIRTTFSDFNSGVSISNKSSDDLVRSFQLKNTAGKSKFDTYNDGENLGDSDKIILNSSGKTDKQIEFESTIIPIELTDGTMVMDDSVAAAINEYGSQFTAGVFPSATLEPSSYNLRYGFIGDSVNVVPLYQKIYKDGETAYVTKSEEFVSFINPEYKDINTTATLYYYEASYRTTSDDSLTIGTTEYSVGCEISNGFLIITNSPTNSSTGRKTSFVPTRIVYNGKTITPDFRGSKAYYTTRDSSNYLGIETRKQHAIKNCILYSDTVKIVITDNKSYMNWLTIPNESSQIISVNELVSEYEDSMGIHSLSFNSKAATSADYFNAADEYFSDLFNYIYSANSIYLSGTVYLNRDQCMSILRNNVIFNIDGEEYIPISIENVPINDNNGGLVDVNLIKKQ